MMQGCTVNFSEHFSYANGEEKGQVERHGNRKINDYHELEAKILTTDGEDFERLVEALYKRNLLHERAWCKTLYSSYYDNPDLQLARGGFGLRIRYQSEPGQARPVQPDISSKTLGQGFGNGTRRTEIESDTRGHFQLNPYLLMADHRHDSCARSHISELLDSMNHNPHALREIFYLDCTRTNFKISLYVVPDEANSTPDVTNYKIKTKDQLNGDAGRAKHAVFEFSLDHSHFYAPSTNGAIYLGSDHEIEFEVMTGEGCKFDPNPKASDPDLTEAEAEAAQQYIFDMIDTILDPTHLSIGGHSKQERGMALRRGYEADNNCEIGFLDRPTRRGNDDVITPDPHKTGLPVHTPWQSAKPR
jgi:hypothetical protein